jgi:hypothetical protein
MTTAFLPSESAALPGVGCSRGLIRWVCTSNPFYVLSALVFCLGLWVSFGSQAEAAQTWALLLGMAGYTLLLAVTACLLVRFVGVWDDVRTVLLLVVLMIMATSVTFDEVLARDPARGLASYALGLLVAVTVSEGILWGIRLELPLLFRVPYHGILALFFLFPPAISPLLDQARSEELAWAMFSFAPAAGLVFLTLLPAIRRGRDYVRDNGSPWAWAWYPWSLFVVLGFGVVARSALICWSMHHLPLGPTEPYIFGPYFLVPFGLAIGVLLLEIGLVEQCQGALAIALVLPAGLLLLTVAGHRPDPVYQWFLGRFIARLGGTPLYLTLLASAGFYAYAVLRRVPMAFDALTVALATFAFVSPHTLDLGELVAPGALPIVAVAVAQTAVGLKRKSACRCLVGAGCWVASVMIVLPASGTGGHPGPIAFHLALIAALAVGAAFDDRIGRSLRNIGTVLAVLGSLAVATGRVEPSGILPSWAMELYAPAMCILLAGYGFAIGHRMSLVSAGLILAAWLTAVGCRGYGSLRRIVVGLDYLVIGLLLFSMAVLTSMAKGGLQAGTIADRSGKVPDATD